MTDTVPPLPSVARASTQWDGGLRRVGILAVACVLALIAAYWFILPIAAGFAAEQVPASVVQLIGDETMSAMDRSVFQPTAVPPARQRRLTERFEGLRFPSARRTHAYRLVFRKSDTLGANAMALPSGTIVLTDALVALSDDDDDLVAVLAHEAGHVEERHGLRQLFQSSTVALAATWLLGDISLLAAAAPAALLQARYSRDLEREADRHAIEVLDENRIPRRHFARVLERLQASARAEGAADEGSLLDYLSSHPVTRERIDAIR